LPVAYDSTATTSENVILNGNVPAATDLDGSIVGYTLVSGTGAGNGSVVLNADGSYSFTRAATLMRWRPAPAATSASPTPRPTTTAA